MLAGDTAADLPIGSYSLSNNDHAPVQIGIRQGPQTVDVREVLANADARAPNLNTLNIEIGPYDQYVADDEPGDMGSSSFSFQLNTVAHGKTPISSGGVDKTILSLVGFTHPWAEAYDAEANLYNLGNVAGALPTVYSQGFADDFHDFVPDLLNNSTTVTPHAFTNTNGAGRTLNVSATHTITRTIDGSGNWTFLETVDATYDFNQFTTGWVEPTDYDVYGSYASYGIYTWGSYGSGYGSQGAFDLGRTSDLNGGGTFNYSFDASGTSSGSAATIDDYDLDSWGNDNFTDIIRGGATESYTFGSYTSYGMYSSGAGGTETVTVEGNFLLPVTSEQVIGLVTGDRTYADHEDATFLWNGSDWTSTYAENGSQTRTVEVESGLKLTRDHDGTQIEHGVTHEYLIELSVGSYTGSGNYAGGVSATTYDGSRVTTNDQDTNYNFDHDGWFDRTLVTVDGANTTTNRHYVTWDEAIVNDHDLVYIDTETFFTDGTRRLVTDQDGIQNATFELDHTRKRISDTTGDFTRHYIEDRGYQDLIDPVTLLPIPELYVEINSVIQKDLTSDFAADGSVTSLTGTDSNVGDTFYRRANAVDGDYTYDRTFTNVGILNSGTQDQEDHWKERLLDEYVNDFNHHTTFHSNDTLTETVIDTGYGEGFWYLHKDGDYRWDGAGTDWTTAIDDEYIHDYGDAWDYDLDANFVAIHDSAGTQLSKLGYYNVTSNTGKGIAGAPPLTVGGPYTSPGEGTVRSTWDHYKYELDYNYSYSYSGSSSYSSYSSYSSGSTTLDYDYLWDRDHLDKFYHNDDYEILWDATGETRTETLGGSGSGHKYLDSDSDYLFASSYSSGMGGSGSENYHDWYDWSDTQDYDYSYTGVITHVKPIGGSFSTNGSVTDTGNSSGIQITDTGYDYTAISDGFVDTQESGDFDETLTFTLGYNVTTTYVANVATETGSATVNTTFSWVSSWSDLYGSGGDSNSGSGSHSLMPSFDVLRAGRKRVIAWQTPLFEVGDEFRRVESWYAEAGIPVQTLIDPHPHAWYGSGYWYGYWFNYGGGFNFN